MFAERFYSGHWDPFCWILAQDSHLLLFSPLEGAAPPQYLVTAEFFRLGVGVDCKTMKTILLNAFEQLDPSEKVPKTFK